MGRRHALVAAFEGLNRREVAEFLGLFHPDVITVDPSRQNPVGRAAALGVHWLLLVACPDVRYLVDDVLEVGSSTVAQVTAVGTNTGPLWDYPASGAQAILPLCLVALWQHSLIVHWHMYWDLPSTLRQIAPAQALVRGVPVARRIPLDGISTPEGSRPRDDQPLDVSLTVIDGLDPCSP